MAGVACTLVAMAGVEEYCALGWHGPVPVLEDPKAGLTYARLGSTYVV
jgi:hypothetical protein